MESLSLRSCVEELVDEAAAESEAETAKKKKSGISVKNVAGSKRFFGNAIEAEDF